MGIQDRKNEEKMMRGNWNILSSDESRHIWLFP